MNSEILSKYLDTYEGRDKFLRVISYAAKLVSGLPSSHVTADKFKRFSSEVSNCRVILRFLDDIPNLHHAMTYNWGKHESDWLVRCVQIAKIAINVVYGPVEHISWAAERKFTSIAAYRWSVASVWFWIASLYLSLVISIRKLKQLQSHQQSLKKTDPSQWHNRVNVKKQETAELLVCIRLMLDISYAVSYLPRGTLWGGRFKPWQVGLLGTISSLIGLYQALSARIANSKR